MMQSMKAKPIAKSKDVRSDGTIIEITIWELLIHPHHPVLIPTNIDCILVQEKHVESDTTMNEAKEIINILIQLKSNIPLIHLINCLMTLKTI